MAPIQQENPASMGLLQAAGVFQKEGLMENEDNWQWLEDIHGNKSMEWVKSMNAETLAGKDIENTKEYKEILKILDSKDKITYARRVYTDDKEFYHNFWQDDEHIKGIWRRTTFEEYQKAKPEWELLLDLDKLGTEEGESWVWKGYSLFNDKPGNRAILKLSKAGSDSVVLREFDLTEKKFVKDMGEPAFDVPDAKSSAHWVDINTVIVQTKLPNTTNDGLTDSGYPRIAKLWKRGEDLYNEAITIYEASQDSVSVGSFVSEWNYGTRDEPNPKKRYHVAYESLTFYTTKYFIRVLKENEDPLPEIINHLLNVPEDVEVGMYFDHMMIKLRKDWGEFKSGSLLTGNANEILETNAKVNANKADKKEIMKHLKPLFVPTSTESLESYTRLKDYIILQLLDNVKTRIDLCKFNVEKNEWESKKDVFEVEKSTDIPSLSASAVDLDYSNEVWFTAETFINPTTLYISNVDNWWNGNGMETFGNAIKLKQQPSFFNPKGIVSQQRFTTSKDGTRIPYFIIGKNLNDTKPKRTLLYGYGGFEVSLDPYYSAISGSQWIEKDAVYVIANIRGGGEYGPQWHQAALKENRPLAYEDFEAVADQLIKDGITTNKLLGCMGGSNGGLLMGNMLVRPGNSERFGAIVCQVPLLDMKRFHLLLAGASWMAEYGNPDEDWEFMKNFSPYQMIQGDAEKKGKAYSKILFTTSTKDDRVHPAHARKMAARLRELTNTSVEYYENIEGGHGGAADNKQRAFMKALEFKFLFENLKFDQ